LNSCLVVDGIPAGLCRIGVVAGAIRAHALITVILRQLAGFFDQRSKRSTVGQFVIKRKVPDVQCKAPPLAAL
jgi:hypothetical protein